MSPFVVLSNSHQKKIAPAVPSEIRAKSNKTAAEPSPDEDSTASTAANSPAAENPAEVKTKDARDIFNQMALIARRLENISWHFFGKNRNYAVDYRKEAGTSKKRSLVGSFF
ncbi:hypothetical protein AZI87_13460 [Bdellovibrio bacteriovorus]|uniref:Uncharacterized protein n=1 Tax=Bdellovibrio bacteriovorus TaxID=959 RepID=A0A162G3K5_BDEBC|nr:hypothetical protein [Bdellovibrio bacteriovorus]KYG64243.1 hypothetical protein AZI87_13460 [Bdellovibrio bacteriovorus]